ncbi:MAG: hypothetical protein HGA54_02385 [Actinobacteria bacterium]|nr:hypothetical protein [Actinomycetota bacterium]
MTLIFGSVLPILLFLAGWWSSIGLVPEHLIFVFASIGFGLGIVIDIVFLRKWLKDIYSINPIVLVLVFLFYSICTLGFFMGVPLFNLIPGAIAGIYMGRRLPHTATNAQDGERIIKDTGMTTAIVMLMICACSAFLALKDPMDTALNLEGMFNTSFSITTEMLIAVIVIGGIFLVTFQYWLTKRAALRAYEY